MSSTSTTRFSPEISFLESAYQHISARLAGSTGTSIYEKLRTEYSQRRNPFEWLLATYGHVLQDKDMQWLLKEYREHLPTIKMTEETASFLEKLRKMSIPMGLVTDGRSVTQRNKLRALGIEDIFCEIIISEEFGSEKPDSRNFIHFEAKYPGREFYFFGDNTSKDFIVPYALGWTTICIMDQGANIHRQDLTRSPVPNHIILSFNEIDFV